MTREEAIEILSEMRSEYNLFGTEEEATRYHCLSLAIKAMGQPEIIRCMECKFYGTRRYCLHLRTDGWEPDSFCSDAERREE